MSNVLPKFNLPTVTIEEVAELSERDQKKSSMKPGLYESTITSQEVVGEDAYDSTWINIDLVYQMAGDREVKDRLSVPTQGLTKTTKDGKQSKYPLQRLVSFLDAIGVEYDLKNLSPTLTTLFGTAGGLLKKSIALQMDYMDNRIVGEGEGADRLQKIVFKNGKVATDESGEVLTFTTREAADAYCKENTIFTFNGVKVRSFEKSANKNHFGAKKTASADW